MLADLTVPFPVLIDHDRRTYAEWGLTRASFLQVWLDPNVWRQYARMLVGGEKLRRGGRDTLQLGGDFVIAPDGTVAYARPQQRDDRPPVGLLVNELEGAARPDGR